MNNKETNIPVAMNRQLAHVDYKTGRCQSMKEHVENILLFSKNICQLPMLESLIKLAKMLHDAGKLGTENQDDFESILKLGDQAHKHGLDHSTAGGRMALELIKVGPVAEFVSTLIYSHHGMEDCINLETGQSLQERRLKKEIEYDHIKECFFQIYDKEMLERCGEEAVQSYRKI